jgi:hypothetical protein
MKFRSKLFEWREITRKSVEVVAYGFNYAIMVNLKFGKSCAMRPMRWKKKYITGVTEIDARQQQMVTLLNDIAVEGVHTEHCQDLNELYAHLTARTETLLLEETQSPDNLEQQLQRYEADVREILTSELPLPAKQGAACRHCGVCDILEKELKVWSDHHKS